MYQMLLVGVLGAVSYGLASLLTLIISGIAFDTVFHIILLIFTFQLIMGFPNRHTANDNTSGVATLLNLMHTLPVEDREKAAFVFLDNEEIGLVGSSKFRKKHRKEIANKLVVNFDCVSDGDYFIFAAKKKARNDVEYPLLKQIIEDEALAHEKKQEFSTIAKAFFPSDQLSFSKSIGVQALKKAPVLGLYLDRIHTSFDTRFDRKNIEFLSRSFTKFVSQLT
jgi:hypothetical protein